MPWLARPTFVFPTALAAIALISPILRPDHVDLRVNGVVITDKQRETEATKLARIYLNGRPTHLVFDNHTYVETAVTSRKGRIAFTTSRISTGAITTTETHCFMNLRGKVEAIPFGAVAIDVQDRVLGLTGSDSPLDDPFQEIPHGWLWQDGRTTDLGPAANLRFRSDGAIEGYAEVLGDGKWVNGTLYAMKIGDWANIRYRAFVWKDGKRTNDLPTGWKPF